MNNPAHSRLIRFAIVTPVLAGCLFVVASAAHSASAASGPQMRAYPSALCPASESLQSCINASVAGDSIVLAPGVYDEQIRIDRSVTLVGSPAGSTLRAPQGARALTIDAPAGARVALNRLTLTGGNIAGDGGALLVVRGSALLNNLVISGNRAQRGGGIAIAKDATVSLKGSRLAGNSATQTGGGVFAAGELTVDGGMFVRNRARLGGAIGVQNNARISGARFEANVATQGGAIAMSMTTAGSVARIDAIHATKNTATQFGGALYLNGAGHVTLSNSTLHNNRANGKGGAIAQTGGALTLSRNALTANSADQSADALLIADTATLTLTDNVLANRDARNGALIELASAAGVTVQGERNTFVGNKNSAIRALDQAGTAITLRDSTFSWFGMLVDSNAGKLAVTLDGALADDIGHPGNVAIFKTRGVRIGAVAFADAANDDFRVAAVGPTQAVAFGERQ